MLVYVQVLIGVSQAQTDAVTPWLDVAQTASSPTAWTGFFNAHIEGIYL